MNLQAISDRCISNALQYHYGNSAILMSKNQSNSTSCELPPFNNSRYPLLRYGFAPYISRNFSVTLSYNRLIHRLMYWWIRTHFARLMSISVYLFRHATTSIVCLQGPCSFSVPILNRYVLSLIVGSRV